MAENLNYNAGGSKCYDNNPANCDKYGRLYDWKTAMKACPPGWHLPSNEELEKLMTAIGGLTITAHGYGGAGKKLKAKSGWNGDGNGTDEFGFSALPGGLGSSDGSFGGVDDNGLWWIATEVNASYAYYWGMSSGSVHVIRNSLDKTLLYSVRCTQD